MSAVQPDVRCRFCGLVMSASFLQRHSSSCDLVPGPCPRGCGALLQPRYLKLHLRAECALRRQRPPAAPGADAPTADFAEPHVGPRPRTESTASSVAAAAAASATAASVTAAAVEAAEAAARAAAEAAVERERGARLAQAGDLAAELGRQGAALGRLQAAAEARDHQVDARLEDLQRQARRALGEAAAARAAAADERDARASALTALAAAAGEEARAVGARVDAFSERLATENALIAGVWRDAAERAEEAAARAERRLDELERDLRGLRARLRDVEEERLRADEARPPGPHQTGRLLWRIDSLQERMRTAQEVDEPLHSPVFYSGPLGYKLRVELWLNGLGQWRDRHIIASLRQLPCEWSPLLPKQMQLTATLTLRDQPEHPREAKDLVKTLVIGRAKGEPKDWHIFIPHTALQQQHYVRDDTIFLDITVTMPDPEPPAGTSEAVSAV